MTSSMLFPPSPCPLPPDHILIGLVGPAGAGKDTVADRLCLDHGYMRTAFADVLRQMLQPLMTALGETPDVLNDRARKQAPLLGLPAASPRRLMQTLGTEWGRKMVSQDVWIRALARCLGMHDLPRSAPAHDRIVITDVRFHDEAAWVRLMGGHIVRVVRDAKPVHPHESEQHLGHISSTLRLDNTHTIERLHTEVDRMADFFAAGHRDPGSDAARTLWRMEERAT